MPCVNFVHVSLAMSLVLCMNTGNIVAQSATDSAFKNTVQVFISSLGDQSPIFNGIQYRRYPDYIHNGQPFFMADSLFIGTVTYDGIVYGDVPLQYDEVNDEVVTTDLQRNNLVQLFKDHVQAFSIAGHNFIHLTNGIVRPGFYRILYNGPSQIIAKETKSIQVKVGRDKSETERSVYASTDYFLKTSKGYQKFNRLNQLVSLFESRQKELSTYIRQNKLRSANDRERAYIQAATFYDQSTH